MENEIKRGKLIAFMGLPGCGKTSITCEIATISGSPYFVEPEENLWPDAVMKREISGFFTALSWFRSIRVPQLYSANELRDKGETVFVDSYYDKLIYSYLEKPGMEWLINPADEYFPVAKQITELDWRKLPNADCVVFLKISFNNWITLVSLRNRGLDRDELFLQSFKTQEYFIDAVKQFAKINNAQVIIHDQEVSSPKVEAEKIYRQLVYQGVIRERG